MKRPCLIKTKTTVGMQFNLDDRLSLNIIPQFSILDLEIRLVLCFLRDFAATTSLYCHSYNIRQGLDEKREGIQRFRPFKIKPQLFGVGPVNDINII
jgi:hypothetical protein